MTKKKNDIDTAEEALVDAVSTAFPTGHKGFKPVREKLTALTTELREARALIAAACTCGTSTASCPIHGKRTAEARALHDLKEAELDTSRSFHDRHLIDLADAKHAREAMKMSKAGDRRAEYDLAEHDYEVVATRIGLAYLNEHFEKKESGT